MPNEMLLLFFALRLPRSLANTPLRMGDEILEINGIPIVNQDQKEVRGQRDQVLGRVWGSEIGEKCLGAIGKRKVWESIVRA